MCVCVCNIVDDDCVVLLWILLRCGVDVKCVYTVYMCIIFMFERMQLIFRLGSL